MIIGSRLKERLLFVSPLQSVRSPRISKINIKSKGHKTTKKHNKTKYHLVCVAAQYLTTVIPYEKNGRPPSLEDLQVLTKSTLLLLPLLLLPLLLLLYTCACDLSTDSPVVHLQFWKP